MVQDSEWAPGLGYFTPMFVLKPCSTVSGSRAGEPPTNPCCLQQSGGVGEDLCNIQMATLTAWDKTFCHRNKAPSRHGTQNSVGFTCPLKVNQRRCSSRLCSDMTGLVYKKSQCWCNAAIWCTRGRSGTAEWASNWTHTLIFPFLFLLKPLWSIEMFCDSSLENRHILTMKDFCLVTIYLACFTRQ